MSNRAPGRNVFIYSTDQDVVLGGLVLTKGMTNRNFHSIVEICFIFENDYALLYENEAAVPRDDVPLQAGKYFIVTSGPLTVKSEPWLVRTNLVFPSCGTRTTAFHDAVRERDGRCIISGELALDGVNGYWDGFEASHIFPLAYEEHWNKHGYSDWVTIPSESGGSINSIQNGILLRTDIQCLFDIYAISINPDDNYKIVCFRPDGKGIAGNHLDQKFLEDPRRPTDKILRWHFKQAVLANVRGEGEPLFECDFPPGLDMMGEILGGPKASERMQFELFSRLAASCPAEPTGR